MKKHIKIISISAISCLLACLVAGVLIAGTNSQEIKRFPELNLVVVYKKIPFYGSSIDLVKFDGERIASRKVSNSVFPEFINVVGDNESIVVLSGESDWVWPSGLWEKK